MLIVVKAIKLFINEVFDFNGETSILLRKPNSLSNISGSPALIEPLKAVKIIIPGLKNCEYLRLDVSGSTGAFWNKAPNKISHNNG